jgi:transcriptional regulator with XRE-family HTH domain
MDLNENIRNNIQRLRKERNITQDVLAAAMEVSVQAISKWETGASLPDIMQLPRIAKFFGVTIDYLFYSESVEEKIIVNGELPNDNIYRVIQFKGNHMLGIDCWEPEKIINLKIPDVLSDGTSDHVLNMEIWGNANVNGNITGYLECNGGVNCGDIGSYIESNGGVNCGNIGSYIESNGGINCGNVGSYIECDGGVNCGNVNGYVECEGNLSCADIMSQVECGGDIRCKEIRGNVECEGNITYER